MTTISKEELRLIQKHSLSAFIQGSFRIVNPQAKYPHNWHIDVMADALECVLLGTIRRLIITIPPRNLKSIAASVAFPAYALGHDPTLRIICASYGQELANKMARDTIQLMQDPFYTEMFATRIPSRPSVADFETQEKGGRMATSVGGVLTGRGGDILIVDDAIKADEALSGTQRKSVNEWYDQAFYSRLNDKGKGAIILIQQRVHLDDLIGHVLNKDDWTIVNLPAIAEEDEIWEYTSLGRRRSYVRRAGEALHPEREPLSALAGVRATLGEYAFAAQYQQSPVPLGGAIVKEKWLHMYTQSECPERFDSIVQSWDTANTLSALADWSVCTTWGVKGKKFYLLHALRRREEYPDLKRTVIAHAKAFGANVVLIEDKASGTQLIQELRQGELSAVKAFKPKTDKVARMLAQTPGIENGFVVFPKDAPWMPEYIAELLAFPMGKYDDQVDSTSQALEYLVTEGAEPGMLGYMRMLAEEMRAQRGF